MKKITKEYQVLNFDELTEDVKDYVIDKWYESEDYPFLEEDISEELLCFDEYNIFENPKLQYSLSYSQGDGLSFEADINILNFLNNIYSKKLPEYKKRAIDEYIWKVYSMGNDGNYCFASKSNIDFFCNYCDGVERPCLDKLWDDILEEITEYYLDICYKLEKSGYSILDYRMNYNEFSETCEANGYTFLKDGKMFNL